MYHRGPDGYRSIQGSNYFLGHRRLSIIDTSDRGFQPFVSEDEKTEVAVNGEIYNYKEIRGELEECGAKFSSQSDSEVILHAYCHWGVDRMLEKIDGMYGVVIHDRESGKIVFFIDRYGVKPLFYQVDGACSKVIVSSEIASLKNYSSDLVVDETAIFDYLVYRYVPYPKSIYVNVFKASPGQVVEINLSTFDVNKRFYWEMSNEKASINVDENKSTIERLIRDSMELQVVSDVPLGFYLSGGVDSSCLLCSARELNLDPRAISLDFVGSEKSERDFVDEFCDKLDHNNLDIMTIEPQDTNHVLGEIVKKMGEPIGDDSVIPTYLLNKKAKDKVTVAIGGDGGDELFCGYSRYKILAPGVTAGKLLFLAKHYIKHFRSKFLCAFRYDERWERYTHLLGGMPASKVYRDYRNLFPNLESNYDPYWHYKRHYEKSDGVKDYMRLDFKTFLPGLIFCKVDFASMLNSVEVRVPFMDRTIVEYAFSRYDEKSKRDYGTKTLLVEYLYRKTGLDFTKRKKRGFGLPGPKYYQDGNSENVFHVRVLKDWLEYNV